MRSRLLVAKLPSGQALSPHEQLLIPVCVRYSVELERLGGRQGGGGVGVGSDDELMAGGMELGGIDRDGTGLMGNDFVFDVLILKSCFLVCVC